MLKDTWTGIVEHMHELGLTAVVKLFKINYNFKQVSNYAFHECDFHRCLHRFYTSPKVRYRPQAKSKDDPEHLNVVFNLIISIVDQVCLIMSNRGTG